MDARYQAECSRIYQQFFLNMADMISDEASTRKTLETLRSQQKKSPGGNPGRITPHPSKTPDIPEDAFLNNDGLEEFHALMARDTCRSRLGETPEPRGRSVSAMAAPSAMSIVRERPEITISPVRERPASVQEKKDFSRKSIVNEEKESKDEYDGMMEPNTEMPSNRRVRINPRAFMKLMGGTVSVKLINKKEKFVLKPHTSSMANVSSSKDGQGKKKSNNNNKENSESQVVDSRERVAIVHQKTTFASPTLSSDLKVSNLVAIQKALKGLPAKRVTVGEVYKSARDRRSRIFRVQMTGNRFDEFDHQEEDTGYKHEVKAATDIGEDVPRSQSRAKHVRMNMLNISAQNRPISRLSVATPIPLHVLDPTLAARIAESRPNTPAMKTQQSVDFALLESHEDNSDFNHRFLQAVEKNRPKERNKNPMSNIHMGFDQPDGRHSVVNFTDDGRYSAMNRAESHLGHVGMGAFPVTKPSLLRSKSAVSAPAPKGHRRPLTSREEKSHPALPLKRISSMRDTAAVVKLWKEEDREREDKLNRWRMRMNFAATRKGGLTKAFM